MPRTHAMFRRWVPSWLRAVVGISVTIPVMLINGAYTGSSVDISSALSVLGEDINMAYYAAAAGMAVGYPLTPKIRAAITTKSVLIIDFILQIILSFICAHAPSIEVVVVCSFLIGFLKAFALLEMIIILKPIFSKKNIRSEFYSYFYPLTFGIGQISMILTAELAYDYQWQYVYYFVIIMLLVAIILLLICFRYGNYRVKIPYKNIDAPSLAIISAALLLFVYVVTYGKIRDWFGSTDIIVCSLLVIPLVWLFFNRQKKLTSPYLNLAVLKSNKAKVGYLFMAVAMFFNSSGSLVTSYATSVLKLDSIHVNGLSLMLIPGFIVGAVVCYWWLKLQIWRFRVLIFWGMACFVAYLALLYFGINPQGTYEYLYLPTFLRGVGMMILFIAFGVYVVEGLDPKLMISNAFFLVSIRSLITPVASASFFTNYIYRSQQKNAMILSQTIDEQNPISASAYQDALNQALSQGQPLQEAQQIALTNLQSTVNVQALLLSIKIIVGYLLIAAIVIMVVSRFIHFHKTLRVKTVRTGDDMA